MATINVGKVKPYRKVRVEHFPEAGAQSFIAGDLLVLSGATVSKGETVKLATSEVSALVGFAAEAASGDTGTMIAVYVADEMGEFVGNVSTVSAADDTLVGTDVGAAFGLAADSTNACWRVDLGEVTAANKVVLITKLLDNDGDTNGRVAFRFVKTANVTYNRQPY